MATIARNAIGQLLNTRWTGAVGDGVIPSDAVLIPYLIFSSSTEFVVSACTANEPGSLSWVGRTCAGDRTEVFSGDKYRAYTRFKKVLEPVTIDIKPGSDPNAINPSAPSFLPVANITDADFDALFVDYETVEFAPPGGSPARAAKGKDVDGDGDADLILHFSISETGITCGDTEATLTGETFDGQAVTGSDSVAVIPCEPPPQRPEKCNATRFIAANDAFIACDPVLTDGILEFEFADRTLYYDIYREQIRHNGWVMYSEPDCVGLVGLYDPFGVSITNVYGVSVEGDVYISDGTSPISWTRQSKVLNFSGTHICKNTDLGDPGIFYDAEIPLDHTSYPTPYTVVPEAQ